MGFVEDFEKGLEQITQDVRRAEVRKMVGAALESCGVTLDDAQRESLVERILTAYESENASRVSYGFVSEQARILKGLEADALVARAVVALERIAAALEGK